MGPTPEDMALSLMNHKPTAATIRQIEKLRGDALTLSQSIFREAPPSRERSIALSRLEESVMWAVKSMVLPRQESLLDD